MAHSVKMTNVNDNMTIKRHFTVIVNYLNDSEEQGQILILCGEAPPKKKFVGPGPGSTTLSLIHQEDDANPHTIKAIISAPDTVSVEDIRNGIVINDEFGISE